MTVIVVAVFRERCYVIVMLLLCLGNVAMSL